MCCVLQLFWSGVNSCYCLMRSLSMAKTTASSGQRVCVCQSLSHTRRFNIASLCLMAEYPALIYNKC